MEAKYVEKSQGSEGQIRSNALVHVMHAVLVFVVFLLSCVQKQTGLKNMCILQIRFMCDVRELLQL